jgi:enamine deaminase RidA (YjgF/YER057c/UK114 family)
VVPQGVPAESKTEQCRYAYDKIKRSLAWQGATLADVVKQVVYVTDIRYQADVAKCRKEAYDDGPIPANTCLVINALAMPGMLLEIDVMLPDITDRSGIAVGLVAPGQRSRIVIEKLGTRQFVL